MLVEEQEEPFLDAGHPGQRGVQQWQLVEHWWLLLFLRRIPAARMRILLAVAPQVPPGR